MEDWVKRCSLSPLALVLGVLWRGPSSLEDMEAYARRLYNGSPLCWDPKILRVAITVLKDHGLVREEDGLLVLVKDNMHPVTRSIASRAAGIL